MDSDIFIFLPNSLHSFSGSKSRADVRFEGVRLGSVGMLYEENNFVFALSTELSICTCTVYTQYSYTQLHCIHEWILKTCINETYIYQKVGILHYKQGKGLMKDKKFH